MTTRDAACSCGQLHLTTGAVTSKSASCAIYLILELTELFNGLMMISDIPLRKALAPL